MKRKLIIGVLILFGVVTIMSTIIVDVSGQVPNLLQNPTFDGLDYWIIVNDNVTYSMDYDYVGEDGSALFVAGMLTQTVTTSTTDHLYMGAYACTTAPTESQRLQVGIAQHSTNVFLTAQCPEWELVDMATYDEFPPGDYEAQIYHTQGGGNVYVDGAVAAPYQEPTPTPTPTPTSTPTPTPTPTNTPTETPTATPIPNNATAYQVSLVIVAKLAIAFALLMGMLSFGLLMMRLDLPPIGEPGEKE